MIRFFKAAYRCAPEGLEKPYHLFIGSSRRGAYQHDVYSMADMEMYNIIMNIVMQGLIWVAAGAVLVLYLKRRRNRKVAD